VAAPGQDQNRAGLGSIDAGPASPVKTDEEDIWLNL
jgi:hypothetical protein